jgi:hypothetical protein
MSEQHALSLSQRRKFAALGMIRRLTSFATALQLAITSESDGEVAPPGVFNESSLAIPVNGA